MFLEMKKNIFYSLLTISIYSQVIFHDDFESYDLGMSSFIDVNYQGTWFEKNINQNTVYTIKKDILSQAQCLDTVGQFMPTAMCIELTSLSVFSTYDIQIDIIMPAWLLGIGVTMKVQWKQQVIQQLNFSTPDISEKFHIYARTQIFEQLNLCFPINSSIPSLSAGPLIDNIGVKFVGVYASQTPQITNDEIQQQSNTTQPKQVTNKSANNQKDINWKFFELGKIIDSVMDWVDFGGFGYLISNLINFWNLIILYYFLGLQAQPQAYRRTLQNLCIFTMKEGSIFNLLSVIGQSQIQIPISQIGHQRIPQSSDDWMSFRQAGLSSNLLANNYEIYFILLFSLLKLALMRCISFLPCQTLKALSGKIKIEHIAAILLYELIMNAHILVFPFAIVWSFSGPTKASQCFLDKINNIFMILTPMFCYFAIILYSYVEQRKIKAVNSKENTARKQEENNNHKKSQFDKQKQLFDEFQGNASKSFSRKSKILQYSLRSIRNIQKMKIQSMQQINLSRPKIWLGANNEQNKGVADLNDKTRWKEYIINKQQPPKFRKKAVFLFNLLDNQLFIFIPVLIGLKIQELFFAFLFLYLVCDLYAIYKLRAYLKPHERFFRILIKFVWLITHLIYFQFFLHSRQILILPSQILQNLGLMSIIMIIIGAFIQLLHSLVNFFIFLKSICKIIFPSMTNNRVQDTNNIIKNLQRTQIFINQNLDGQKMANLRQTNKKISFASISNATMYLQADKKKPAEIQE